MRLDKKVANNRLRFVLLERLGDAFVTSDYTQDALAAGLGVTGS
jgi:3-dehydroquinate synthetase